VASLASCASASGKRDASREESASVPASSGCVRVESEAASTGEAFVSSVRTRPPQAVNVTTRSASIHTEARRDRQNLIVTPAAITEPLVRTGTYRRGESAPVIPG
jgi:hypothetical protein